MIRSRKQKLHNWSGFEFVAVARFGSMSGSKGWFWSLSGSESWSMSIK